MRRAVTVGDISLFAKVDMVYNQVRVIEAKQNQTKYKCLGSGECCRIGLVIHMAECANIAFKLRQQYYLYLEDKGQECATDWLNGVVSDLKEAMYDEDWVPGGETKRHCAFYKGGCTIYAYRPMVCRSFGTITSVDNYCPRIRNANGEIDFFTGDSVHQTIVMFQQFLKEYSEGKDIGYNLVVYMPLGVLSFFLDPDELEELQEKTDPKFWTAVQGWFNYRVQFTKLHGYTYEELGVFAKDAGVPVSFREKEVDEV